METFNQQAEQISQAGLRLDRLAPRVTHRNVVESVVYDGRYVQLSLAPSAEQRESHVRPGQYVVARFQDGMPRFIALYSVPGASSWEFLFEPKPDWDLNQFAPGATIQVSEAEGPGFPLEFGFSKASVFVGGSGIAGVLPWLEAGPQVDEVEVVFHLSDEAPLTLARVERAVDGLNGVLSHVDYPTLVARAAKVPQDHAVLLCGSPRMMHEVAQTLLGRGFLADQIFTNL